MGKNFNGKEVVDGYIHLEIYPPTTRYFILFTKMFQIFVFCELMRAVSLQRNKLFMKLEHTTIVRTILVYSDI